MGGGRWWWWQGKKSHRWIIWRLLAIAEDWRQLLSDLVQKIYIYKTRAVI